MNSIDNTGGNKKVIAISVNEDASPRTAITRRAKESFATQITLTSASDRVISVPCIQTATSVNEDADSNVRKAGNIGVARTAGGFVNARQRLLMSLTCNEGVAISFVADTPRKQ